MQRRALLAAVVALPLAGCGDRLSYGDATPTREPTETPKRAVSATFETFDGGGMPYDDDRASARIGDGRIAVIGRASVSGCHDSVLGDVTLIDWTLGLVVDQRARDVDRNEVDCGGGLVDYRVELRIAPTDVETIAVEHHHPEYGTTFEREIDLASVTATRGSPVVSTTAEEP